MNRSRKKNKQKSPTKFGLTREEFEAMSVVEKFRWMQQHGDAEFKTVSLTRYFKGDL